MKIDYSVSLDDDIMEQVAKNQPDPEIIIDLQNTLRAALQPIQMPGGQAAGPMQASAGWGKAEQG